MLLLMHILHTVPAAGAEKRRRRRGGVMVLCLVVGLVCPDEFDTNGFHHF